jgi:hypothetical protein
VFASLREIGLAINIITAESMVQHAARNVQKPSRTLRGIGCSLYIVCTAALFSAYCCELNHFHSGGATSRSRY